MLVTTPIKIVTTKNDRFTVFYLFYFLSKNRYEIQISLEHHTLFHDL